MSILSFFRRTKSKYADDKAVEDFTRVVDQAGILKPDPIDDLAALMSKDDPSDEEIAKIGKLLSGE